MDGQGREGVDPESRLVELGKEDNEDGKGASESVGRRMPAIGRTMEEDTRQEKPRARES